MRGRVVALAFLFGAQVLPDRIGPDQAADMGGQNAIGAAVHGALLAWIGRANRYQVEAGLQTRQHPVLPTGGGQRGVPAADRHAKRFLNGEL